MEHNSFVYLRKFIHSIENINNVRITIFDNNSNYIVRESFDERIEVITSDKNLGYGKAVNIVAKQSDSEYLFVCNSDLIFLEDTFSLIENFVNENPHICLFGVQQLYPDLKKQHSFGDIVSLSKLIYEISYIKKIYFRFRNLSKIKKVNYIDGAFIVIKNETFKQINGFDEDFHFYSEDSDLCYRAKLKGINSYFNPNIKIIHFRGASSELNLINTQKAKLFVDGIKIFLKKHHSEFYSKIYFLLYRFSLNQSIIVNRFIYLLKPNPNILVKIENFKLLLNQL